MAKYVLDTLSIQQYKNCLRKVNIEQIDIHVHAFSIGSLNSSILYTEGEKKNGREQASS